MVNPACSGTLPTEFANICRFPAFLFFFRVLQPQFCWGIQGSRWVPRGLSIPLSCGLFDSPDRYADKYDVLHYHYSRNNICLSIDSEWYIPNSSMIFTMKRPNLLWLSLGCFGSPARTRTADPMVNSHLLCQLSYWGSSALNQIARVANNRAQIKSQQITGVNWWNSINASKGSIIYDLPLYPKKFWCLFQNWISEKWCSCVPLYSTA